MTTPGWGYHIEYEGRSVEVAEGEVSVGRSRECTVVLKDATVSRKHAILWFEGGRAKLRDMGSANGSFLNGRRVEGEAPVSDGDRLTVGETELVVRLVAPVGSPEATVKIELGQLYCSRCGAPVPAGARACVACGHLISAAELPTPQLAQPLPPAPVRAPEPAAAKPAAAMPITEPGTPPPPPTLPPLPPAAPRPAPAAAAPAAPPPQHEVLSPIRDIDLSPSPQVARPGTAVPMAKVAAAAAAGASEPAGFWIRLLAYLIDVALVMVAYLVVAGPFFLMGSLDLGLLLGSLVSFGVGLGLPLVGWAKYGTTPGKYLLRLYVTTPGGRPGQGLGFTKALVRLLGYLVSSIALYIGFLMIAFQAEKKGLHDLIAGTAVRRRK